MPLVILTAVARIPSTIGFEIERRLKRVAIAVLTSACSFAADSSMTSGNNPDWLENSADHSKRVVSAAAGAIYCSHWQSGFKTIFNTRSPHHFEKNRQTDCTLLRQPDGIGRYWYGALLRPVSDTVWLDWCKIRDGYSNIDADSWTDSSSGTWQSADLVWPFQSQPKSDISCSSQNRKNNH